MERLTFVSLLVRLRATPGGRFQAGRFTASLPATISVMPSTGVLSLMNGYQSTYGGPSSPSVNNRVFSQANSPGTALDLYSPVADRMAYIQATNAPQFAVTVGVSVGSVRGTEPKSSN